MLSEHDQERFMRLWTESQPAVVNFIYAAVRDSAAARDLAQETALVVFRRFHEYDGDRPFLAWALGVAKLRVLGFHREHEERLHPMFNETSIEEVILWSPEVSIVVDGDLSEWSDAGLFRAARTGPDARGQFVEGRMRYDAEFLYIAAHVGDPAPMRNVLLNAPRAPRPGDTLAMSWTAHWSDEGGRLWRGQLVELRNAAEPPRIHTWERAATWGRAVFQ